MSFKSDLCFSVSFMSPKSTSVLIFLSWASSSIITEYYFKQESSRHSLNIIPSVIYFIIVFYDVKSSNLIWYPTSLPSFTPISSLTLFATEIAATLLGCVHAIFLPYKQKPSSMRYCVSWVVLPEPVSPINTRIWFSFIVFISSSFSLKIGSDSFYCFIVKLSNSFLLNYTIF